MFNNREIEQAQRIDRSIIDTASNVIARHQLPPQIHVLVKDAITGLRFGAFAGIEYLHDGSSMFKITRTSIGQLRENVPASEIADMLLEHSPGTPLVCDRAIADELRESGSINWFEEDHCQLVGLPHGVLDVFVKYDTSPFRGTLPPSVRGQTYLE